MNILRANHMGIRDFKEHFSAKYFDEMLVITDRGDPVGVALPYSDVLELIDIIDELSDSKALRNVQEGRAAISAGAKGISVSKLFNKIRSTRK